MATIMFPNEEDVDGAAVAMLRLQETYHLDTNDLSNGIIVDNHVAQNMTGILQIVYIYYIKECLQSMIAL